MKKLYLITGSVFIIAAALLLGIMIMNQKTRVTPQQAPAGYQLETLGNMAVIVPEGVKKESIGDEVVFSRSFNATYQSSCDFIGVGKETLKDSEIGLRYIEGSLISAFDGTMNRPGAYKDYMDDKGALLEGMGEKMLIGKKEVTKISMSVENCGQTYYFVPKGKGYLIVRTPIASLDFSEQGMNYAKLQTLSGNTLRSEEKMNEMVQVMISSL